MLRIERIEPYPLFYRIPKPYGDANGIKAYRTSYLIRVITSEGIEGWGESSDYLPVLHLGFQERIIPYLIGKPFSERKTLLRTIHRWHPRAAAALSMAFTEIEAVRSGVSICELWGGCFHQRVPVYASFQSYSEEEDWQQRSLRAVEQAVSEGFSRLKLKIGGKSIAEDQRHINRVQGLLEQTACLALDANESYDAAAALEWNALFAAWPNMMWLEEPIPMHQVNELALLRRRMSIPIGGGEHLRAAADFIPLLTQQALDIITPDPAHLNSIEEYQHALRLARDFGLRASPHAFDGALARLYALFAQACLEPWNKMEPAQIEPVEWDMMDNPFNRLIPLSPSGGEITLPQGPGIGAAIDREILEHYRWDGRSY